MGGSPDRPDQSQAEIDLAKRGARQWNEFVKNHAPAALETAERQRRTSADDLRAAEQSASAAVQQTPTMQTIADQAPGGAEGGAAVAAAGETASNQAVMTGVGRARAGQDADRREHVGLMQAAGVGRGVDSSANAGMTDAARGATQANVTDAQTDWQNTRHRRQLVTSGLGLAAGYMAGPSAAENRAAQDLHNAEQTHADMGTDLTRATRQVARDYDDWAGGARAPTSNTEQTVSSSRPRSHSAR